MARGTYTGGKTLKNKATSVKTGPEVDQHKIKMFETIWSTLTEDYDIFEKRFCHILYPSPIVRTLQDQTRYCQAWFLRYLPNDKMDSFLRMMKGSTGYKQGKHSKTWDMQRRRFYLIYI